MSILISGGFSLETVTFRKKLFDHFKRNKGKYISGGLCLMVGSVVGVYLSINRRAVDAANTFKTIVPATITMPKVNDDAILESLNIVSHIGRNGHPGNVIYCNETKQVFKSHREAARELGIDCRDLWAYFKGLKSSARGYTFKGFGEARSSAV
jgi:hypothetical protein